MDENDGGNPLAKMICNKIKFKKKNLKDRKNSKNLKLPQHNIQKYNQRKMWCLTMLYTLRYNPNFNFITRISVIFYCIQKTKRMCTSLSTQQFSN